MHRLILACLAFCLLALPGPARAFCQGQNLIAALPAADRAALRARAEAAPYARGLFYQARRGDQQVTVIGTYHLNDPRHDALETRAHPYLETASALLVEAGPDEMARLKTAIASDPALSFITDGPTLPERLDGADWQRLRAAMEARGIPAPLTAKMQPWYAAVTLALSPCMIREAAKGEPGLDQRLIDQATGAGLPVQALEPWDTVFGIFDGLIASEEEDMILVALASESHADDYAITLADAYFNAEPRLLWEFGRLEAERNSGLTPDEVARQMELAETQLMVARNRNWIAGIEDAAIKGPVVVAVGALHLSGDEGILRLLERNGWAITRLDQ